MAMNGSAMACTSVLKNFVSFHTIQPTNALKSKIYFLHIICRKSFDLLIYLDHLQGVSEHQQSIYKNKVGLLNTLKFGHKVFVDVISKICM